MCSSGEGRMWRMQLQVVLQRIVPPAAQPLNPDAPLSSFSLLFSPSAAASWVRTAGLLVRMFPPQSCAITCLLLSSNRNKLLNIYVYFKEGDVSGCTHTSFYTCACLPCITQIANVMKVYILCSLFIVFTAVMVTYE